jgi:hypothetical protein
MRASASTGSLSKHTAEDEPEMTFYIREFCRIFKCYQRIISNPGAVRERDATAASWCYCCCYCYYRCYCSENQYQSVRRRRNEHRIYVGVATLHWTPDLTVLQCLTVGVSTYWQSISISITRPSPVSRGSTFANAG